MIIKAPPPDRDLSIALRMGSSLRLHHEKLHTFVQLGGVIFVSRDCVRAVPKAKLWKHRAVIIRTLPYGARLSYHGVSRDLRVNMNFAMASLASRTRIPHIQPIERVITSTDSQLPQRRAKPKILTPCNKSK